jgi:hypothetical protein
MNWKGKWGEALAAITFAEAGCSEYARYLLGQGEGMGEAYEGD